MISAIVRILFPISMFLYGYFAIRPLLDAGVDTPIIAVLIAAPIIAFLLGSVRSKP